MASGVSIRSEGLNICRFLYNIALILILAFVLIGALPHNTTKELRVHPLIRVRAAQTESYQLGYQPSQIKHAYGIDRLTARGGGTVVAVIVPFGSPTIQKDLNIFNTTFKLPPAQLNVAYPQGKPKRVDSEAAQETAMDVEWVHALAPRATILLVVAVDDELDNMMGAIDYASTHGADVISMSWGVSEFSDQSEYDAHFRHPGVVYVASSGDSGAEVIYPAVSPYVVSVGGTTLLLDAKGNLTSPEIAWSGSGGGISAYEPQPKYQSTYRIDVNSRAVPDVAFLADPDTGVAFYSSTGDQGNKGWLVGGGTSLGAPCWAALIALADQGRRPAISDGHNTLYQLATEQLYAANYRDITIGSNGYLTWPGYDLVTGLGSPLANNLVHNMNTAKNITVTSPNGGENWNIGTTQNITWTSDGLSGSVKIELSRDGGSTWKTIVPSTANDGSQAWKITGPATDEARIRVVSITNRAVLDISDGNFTIGSP